MKLSINLKKLQEQLIEEVTGFDDQLIDLINQAELYEAREAIIKLNQLASCEWEGLKIKEVGDGGVGRFIKINGCDWDGKECSELQLTISQSSYESFIDLSLTEVEVLVKHFNHFIRKNNT